MCYVGSPRWLDVIAHLACHRSLPLDRCTVFCSLYEYELERVDCSNSMAGKCYSSRELEDIPSRSSMTNQRTKQQYSWKYVRASVAATVDHCCWTCCTMNPTLWVSMRLLVLTAHICVAEFGVWTVVLSQNIANLISITEFKIVLQYARRMPLAMLCHDVTQA